MKEDASITSWEKDLHNSESYLMNATLEQKNKLIEASLLLQELIEITDRVIKRNENKL